MEIVEMHPTGATYLVETTPNEQVEVTAIAATVEEQGYLREERGVRITYSSGDSYLFDVDQAGPLAVAMLAAVSYANGGVTLEQVVSKYGSHIMATDNNENGE